MDGIPGISQQENNLQFMGFPYFYVDLLDRNSIYWKESFYRFIYYHHFIIHSNNFMVNQC
jgi:hypothetical protein